MSKNLTNIHINSAFILWVQIKIRAYKAFIFKKGTKTLKKGFRALEHS
jgi:hypothetical protein